MQSGQKWLNLQQASEYVGVAENTIRAYVRQGRLKAYRVAGRRQLRFLAEDLDTLMEPIERRGAENTE